MKQSTINKKEKAKIIKIVNEVRHSLLKRNVTQSVEIKNAMVYNIQDFIGSLCIDNENSKDPNLSSHIKNKDQVNY